ncbi:MAG TPA: hypothetical protein VK660_03695 [Xanthomonadaceae bacterium]|jgi:hypothetical protein|nr:hypothetical protein [Xanthomonadaceae bacterium]
MSETKSLVWWLPVATAGASAFIADGVKHGGAGADVAIFPRVRSYGCGQGGA